MNSKRLDNPSARTDFSSKRSAAQMSECTLTEMQGIVRAAAQPYEPGEPVKGAIVRAARRLGMNYRRARAYWYGEVRLVPAHEADHLRALRPHFFRWHASELAKAMRDAKCDAAEILTLVQELHQDAK